MRGFRFVVRPCHPDVLGDGLEHFWDPLEVCGDIPGSFQGFQVNENRRWGRKGISVFEVGV